jgi:hypothetical protein
VSGLAVKSSPPQNAPLAALSAAKVWLIFQRQCRLASVAWTFHSLRPCVQWENILGMPPLQRVLLDRALGIMLAAQLQILWHQRG